MDDLFSWVVLVLGFIIVSIIKKDFGYTFIALVFFVPFLLLFELNILQVDVIYNILIFVIVILLSSLPFVIKRIKK